ncbi:MAG: hypothetical protein JWN20_1797, partial [Jatrophihabitantaceae bacterium]|nr:hypothetical protein [Jatrophihabitantaceae bacterium]
MSKQFGAINASSAPLGRLHDVAARAGRGVGSRMRRGGFRRSLAVVGVFALAALALPLTSAAAAAADGQATVVQEDGVNGCEGVRTTPGSENTMKRLIGGTLEPGGTAIFEISYPVSTEDVNGRTTFVITDCVFIDDTAVVKYTVSFVPNTENYLLTFSVTIPAGTAIGAEFCNYAKTTAAPSDSPASNRKAGPACFHVGGDLRIIKVATGDASQTPLVGATFTVSCPTTVTVPPVVISGLTGSTSYAGGAYVASGVADAGVIAIAGPAGTTCTVTETAPAAGYDLPSPATFTYTIPLGSDQVIHYIANTLSKVSPTISTVASPAAGTVGVPISPVSDKATFAGTSSAAP